MVAKSLLIVLASVAAAAGCARAPASFSVLPIRIPAVPELEAAGDTSLRASLPAGPVSDEVRIGPNDLLEVEVFEAPELNRSVRVSGRGEISLPLLGEVPARGLTPRELELVVQDRLRARYILDPHVSVQVKEAQSRAVSVVGAVNRPGVFQLPGPRPLLEVLALAEGLSPEAGESVIVVRADRGTRDGNVQGPSAPEEQINLRQLLESGDPRLNVPVHPGDVVTVKRAGVIYVVGDVKQPGAFPLQSGSGLTLLQAVALGEGLLPTAAKGRILVIHTTDQGERIETSVDLGEVIAGRIPDPQLQPRDVVFVPNSSLKSITFGAIDALVRMVTLRGIF